MNVTTLTHGFCADGVAGERKPCKVLERFQAACDVHEEMAKKTDFYLTMYAFPDEFVRDVSEGRCALRGYTGVCWSPMLWFDIDRENDLQSAVRDTVKLIEYLVALGVEAWNIQQWFSGKKGFHVGLPTCVFGAQVVPDRGFAARCKQTALAISQRAGITIDRAVYDRVRLLRCPNTRHGATRLYKVPVTLESLREPLTASTVGAWAKSPRPLTGFTMPTQTIPSLERIWREAENTPIVWATQTKRTLTTNETMPRLRKQTFDFIRHGAEKGERANRLFQAAADCTRCGWSQQAIFSLLPEVAVKSGLTASEAERQIRNGIECQRKEAGHVC